MAIFPSTSIASAAGGYDIDNSCRFDGSSVLTWTPSGTADTTTTCTISFWIKHTDVDLSSSTWVYGVDAQDEIFIRSSTKNISYQYQLNNAGWGSQIPVSMQRDPSAWYHIVINFDTAQAVAADRTKYYINGALQTCTGTLPNQNDTFSFGKGGVVHRIGSRNSTAYMSGYLAEFHQVIGTALTADSFGEEGDYGEWKPKSYSGSHGTNGFYLDFKNSASLGNDAAGSNNFTPTNITASDQMVDSPTNNFCTMNPVAKAGGSTTIGTFAEGNLKVGSSTTAWQHTHGTIGVTSGKWYFEAVTTPTNDGDTGCAIGFCDSAFSTSDPLDSGTKNAKFYGHKSGKLYNNDTGTTASSTTFAADDILQIALDLDNGKMWFGKNGTWYNNNNASTTLSTGNSDWTGITIDSSGSGEYTPFGANYNDGTIFFNFGQDGTFAGNKTAQGNADGNGYGNFYYAPPSGFLALCSKNLSDPTVTPSEHFNTVLYTGNSTTNAITDVGFQPDMVWLKGRSQSSYHGLYDVVRGAGSTKGLYPNANEAEGNNSAYQNLVSFDSDGFTLGATSSSNVINDNTQTYVGWNWKANGSGASNTDGTINTTATSANTAAGFSIVSYTGDDASSATIGHGLSKAPELIILKPRNKVDDWIVGSIQPVASMDFTDYLTLQADTALGSVATFWNDTAPTSSVFTVGTSNTVNGSYNYIAYCWHSVEGYSKIGSYVGNGNANGPFIYTGFRPAFVITKYISSIGHWRIKDNKRDTYNKMENTMWANMSSVEQNENDHDWCANGFKIRNSGSQENASGGKFIYMAFAETPFKHATAR